MRLVRALALCALAAAAPARAEEAASTPELPTRWFPVQVNVALGASVERSRPLFAHAIYAGGVFGHATETGWGTFVSAGMELAGRRGTPETIGPALRGGAALSGGRGDGGLWPDLILYAQLSGFLSAESLSARNEYLQAGVRGGVGLTGMWLRRLCKAAPDGCQLLGYAGLLNHVQVQYEWSRTRDLRAPLSPLYRDESRWILLAGFGF